jgi:hypothetical protein
LAIRRADSAILQADSGAALSALRQVPAEEFVGEDGVFRACMIGRFDTDAPTHLLTGIADNWVRDVLARYQEYWWHAMAAPQERVTFERSLLQQLEFLLASDTSRTDGVDALENRLELALETHGYHSLRGRTPPLRELMLWRAQERRDYDVDLPEGSEHVRVEILDDFVSRGWNHYGNCGKTSTGGWAGNDRLFAVRSAYKSLDGEQFRVSFLSHEAQHFADRHHFPDLANWELEYRAKLVELSQADETRDRLLSRFAATQGDDIRVPHSYANGRVLAALRRALGTEPSAVEVHRLQEIARSILLEDTKLRVAKRQ